MILGPMETIDPSVYERADEGLLRLLEKAKVAALTDQEIDQYEAAMKALEDEIDLEQHGFERGLEKGEIRQAIKTARIMIAASEPIEKIMAYSGLSKEEIEKLM